MGRCARWLLVGLVAVLGLLVGASWSSRASAADVVSVTPDASSVSAGSASGFVVALAGDTDASRVRFLLPSHGRPCGFVDELGDPAIGSDPTTNFVVTDADGGVVSGRWITWVGDFSPGWFAHVLVVTPPLGGCFYSGATATSSTHVTGLRRGGVVFNDQGLDLATGGSVFVSDRSARVVLVTWWMRNGTSDPVTLSFERLGASDGFVFDSSSFAGLPKTAALGVSWSWSEQLVIPAGGQVLEQVLVERPCGNGSVNLRLRIVRSDGLAAGTGNGVPVDLAAC